MQIQINTDNHIEGHEKLAAHVKEVVEHALNRFNERVTRVEVHLSDENSDKNGQDDKRCVMEARIKGLHPAAVTCQAATLGQAVDGAVDKLKRSLDHTLEREASVRRNAQSS